MGREDRSRSPGGDHVVERAVERLRALCDKAGVPPSHGLDHALRVLEHADAALEAPEGAALGAARRLAVRLAALLHDADDRKLFSSPKGSYPNALQIMREAGAEPLVSEEVLRMIGLVSCSANGNSAPPEAEREPELLWPRWADRLEATGEVGAVRCLQYNREVGTALSVEATPRPRSEQEVWQLATPERFAEYQRSGGSSASMMDHYFDKLLQVARPSPELVRNSYLQEQMERQAAPLVRVCLAFGATGQVPLDIIAEMASRVGVAGG